jgi:organic hydroperoxide reductase OsmC/OhrA
MAGTRARRFEYAVEVGEDGAALAEGQHRLPLPPEWTPEHLVLAGLIRCSLTSLAYHARRAGRTATGSGTSAGMVTRRDEDGRFAFVEISCRFEVEIEPLPEETELAELLALAERDCFIGASLRAKPTYEWLVNAEGGG